MLKHGTELIDWLSANSAAHATVLLVFITMLYVILTWRMARAMAQQTRATVQPVISLTIIWEPKFNPKGYFTIKNIGTQPLLLLEIRITCNSRDLHLKHDFSLWNEHMLGPKESLSPLFDFIPEIEKAYKAQASGEFWRAWSPGEFGYSFEIVASDLSRQVVNRYVSFPVLKVITHGTGMPLRLRWRFFMRPIRQRYFQLKYFFRRQK